METTNNLIDWSLTQTAAFTVSFLLNIVLIYYVKHKDKLIEKINKDLLEVSKDYVTALGSVTNLFNDVIKDNEKLNLAYQIHLTDLGNRLEKILTKILAQFQNSKSID